MSSSADAILPEMVLQGWLDANFNSHLLAYFAHGVYTGIFGMSIWLLLVNSVSRARIYMGCIITALYIFATIAAIALWIDFSDAFVIGTSFQARYDLMSSSVLLETMSDIVEALNLLIADCIMIWRCWVVWGHDWKVVITPIFFVIIEIACGCILLVHQTKDDVITIAWALPTMAMTLGTNILCTGLIVGRIIHVARGHRGVMGGIRTYRGVIEILVESAALYSLIYMALMILYPLEGYGYTYAQRLTYPITGIAPTLIIARVASGQARPVESSHETQSSLHFQASRGSTTEAEMDDVEEDMMQGNMEGTTLITGRLELSGSVEEV
ncbi:uncharacterized protein BT62DRAFT_935025 [Guyanagaster necrorhizus]|uniref:Uncharacterized protein n=1 Tax=Guyanagaster necrorhizus TaxID=856835 RepID=A0A9P7VMS7_9AGAR|nr:uncharacterized protein BT62DRAFT_935025 [Guyanagaster necrorhizus MCA 3950]KAG7443408.1 hypothetical protein BT62DRAFT_935025 [Guyanagaster necrorhizus MCA 3950]